MTTKIEVCDHTWNVVTGCGMGCSYCYARRMANRNLHDIWIGRQFDEVRFHPERLDWPTKKRWKPGSRIFVDSMGDLFDPAVKLQHLKKIFRVMAAHPELEFQILTKRPERMMQQARRVSFPSNAWLGVSIENQEAADKRLPRLVECDDLLKASIKYVTIEPMFGPVDLEPYLPTLDWVIVAGMTGPGANKHPLDPDWVRSARDQCVAYKVPLYFKQWGRSKKYGASLDGREHREFPVTGRPEACGK